MSADQQTPVPQAPPAVEKSYATALVLVILLYFFLFPAGLIANAIYLADANAYRRRTGRDAIMAPWVRRLMILGVALLVIGYVAAFYLARVMNDMIRQMMSPEARGGANGGAYPARASSCMARMLTKGTWRVVAPPARSALSALPRQTSMA